MLHATVLYRRRVSSHSLPVTQPLLTPPSHRTTFNMSASFFLPSPFDHNELPLSPLSTQSPVHEVPATAANAPPPPYSIDTLTVDPTNLARALRDYQANQDPEQWGSRRARTSNHTPQDEVDDDLPPVLRWLKWFAELMGDPTNGPPFLHNMDGPPLGHLRM
jgi:hypothetical protein